MNNTIEINGVSYTRTDTIQKSILSEINTDGLEYVIVRGDRSGVFAGYLKEKTGREVTLVNVRRIWYWDGAASISQIALQGVTKPENCKFTVETSSIKILDTIEILATTQTALENIQAVPVWKQ